MKTLKIKIRKVNAPGNVAPVLPCYMTAQAAGMDLFAANAQPLTLMPMERSLVPTGVAIELPDGYEAQVRPRSGLAIRHGITMLNSPGTIDPDYRGEIKVIMANMGQEPFIVCHGERIAQLVVSRFEKVEWELCDELTETARGDGGFGHTGKS